ncbi:MAG: hypothetical protein HKN68_00235 [Saprospiraceae bacterium]|nr:hypothetical protein [Saprospiraceae bacterium]
MKQTVLFIFLLTHFGLTAQKVGVNITSPEFTLDVRSSSIGEPSQFNISNLDKSRYVRFFSGSDAFPDPSMSWNPSHNFLFATFDDVTLDFSEKMRISSTGEVGIGIANPTAQLDLKGGDWNLDAGNPGDLRIGDDTYNLRIGVATGGGGAGISRIYSSNNLLLGVDNATNMTLDSEGETGFGTTNPSQKVDVNGKIKIGDDAKAPTEGTIRYNSTSKSFEGYDGTKWIKLGGSSPYGLQGTFNLPNSIYASLNIPGAPDLIRVAQNMLVVRSEETVIIGYEPLPPFNPIYGKNVYINLYQKITNSQWVNKLSLTDEALETTNDFATGIALSENRLLIGDPEAKEVIEYSLVASNWTLTKTFESPGAFPLPDDFGYSIAIDGQKTIIGAPRGGPGKAYIYDDTDNLEATLGGPGPTSGDLFGLSVDLSNNRAIIGAPGDNSGSSLNVGSASIFNKVGNIWSTNFTFFDQSIEENEYYGINVVLEDSDYFYISGANDGIDAYLVENGFWTHKETISGQGTNYYVASMRHEGFDKMVFLNKNSDSDKINFLIAGQRDANNFFVNSSSLINGTSDITSFDISGNIIYTLGSDDKLYTFEY